MNKEDALTYLNQFYENQYQNNYDNYSGLGNWLRATFGWFQDPKVVALSTYLKSLAAGATVDPERLRALGTPAESSSATESSRLVTSSPENLSSLDQILVFIGQLLGLIKRAEYIRVDNEANLEKFPVPTELPSPTTEVTLGDLHGNAMKLIYFLLQEGVIEGLNAADYKQLLELYYTPLNDLRSAEIDAHMKKFNELINKIKLPDNPAHRAKLVRLIGDVLADRGMNDYYTLRILKKLKDIGLNVEIEASNHDLSFLTRYSQPSSDKIAARFTNEFLPGQAASAENLTILLNRPYSVEGLRARLRAEVAEALPAYRATIKLVGYSLSPDRTHISIYTHAPVGLETLRELATELGVTFEYASAEELARSIDRINEAALEKINNSTPKQIAALFAKAPFQRLIWALYSDATMRYIKTDARPTTFIPLDRPASIGAYTLAFIHGHTNGETGLEHIFNLDSDFGKKDLVDGTYLSYRRDAAPLAVAEARPHLRAEDGVIAAPDAAPPLAIAAISLSPTPDVGDSAVRTASPATLSDGDLPPASHKPPIAPVTHPHPDTIDLARACGHAYLQKAADKTAPTGESEEETGTAPEEFRGF